MNLDELRSVQNRERQTDSLQHLRDSFYEEVGRYIADLKAERERVAERSEDPWSDPEIQQLSDEIDTAEEVAESIYERRMGKLVKDASLAAAGYATDTEGLTLEEERLFEDLVDRIEANKSSVLEVLSGDAIGSDAMPTTDAEPASTTDGEPAAADETEPTPESDPATTRSDPAPQADPTTADTESPARDQHANVAADEGIDAASMMEADPHPTAGGDRESPTTEDELTGDPLVDETAAEPDATDGAAPSPAPDPAAETDRESNPETTAGQPTTADGADGGRETVGAQSSGQNADEPVERTTVRIKSDIGEILGIDDHEYHLSADDVVTLPEENAEPLVERGAAEPLE